MQIPRIIIAGITSGVGKTTVALAIMYALYSKKGLKVQPFKVGPDFIDPSYHTFVTGRKSRNLDAWMMGTRGIKDCFVDACEDADIAVVEGVMGLFDGLSGKNNFASTAHIAKIIDAPVVLVVDASKGARSIAAIVLGFLLFDKNIRIAGVILNNVASKRHASYLVDAFAEKVKVPILGIIERNNRISLEERHLGLIPTAELYETKQRAILNAAKDVSDELDIDMIIGLCNNSPLSCTPQKKTLKSPNARIAVALDESFNFYYADNLEALRRRGAQTIFFSPIHDARLPENIQGIMLGGGFPEVLADKLEKNRSMINSIKKAVDKGSVLYGECGGLMYLTRSIRGYKGKMQARKMVGLVDAGTVVTNKLTLNYTKAVCHGPILQTVHLQGHEFHYSKIEDISNDSRFAYSMEKGYGITGSHDGFVINENGLAAYMHLHFSNNNLSDRIVRACVKYSRR